MRRSGAKVGLALCTMFLFLGIANLVRYSDKVRLVHLLGISAGGAQVGAGLAGIIVSYLALTGRIGPRGAWTPPQEQAPPPEKKPRMEDLG
jgi:hypothetical protein